MNKASIRMEPHKNKEKRTTPMIGTKVSWNGVNGEKVLMMGCGQNYKILFLKKIITNLIII